MRIERIEETTEANRVAAESVAWTRALDGPEGAPDARVARLFPALARLLSCSPAGAHAKTRTAVLAEASRLLGTALGADHVGIYLSGELAESTPDPSSTLTPAPFVLAARYSRLGLAGDVAFDGLEAIDLSPAADAGRRLIEGCSTRVFRPLAHRRRALGSTFSAEAGWSRIHATLRVPCPGQNGLLALITLDGPFLDSRASRALVEQAEAAASWVASYLERDRLGRELESMRAEMRAEKARTERLAALGRVASSAAHDFNNVLTAILGHADLLELELPAGAVATRGLEDLDEIRVAVTRGAKLVEELLAFGRKRPAGEQAIDLARSLAGLDSLLRRVAGDGIEVEARIEAGLPAVRMDLERFERLIVNLVVNARHAIEARPGQQGRIELSLDRVRDGMGAAGGESVRLRVRDNGCGMDAIVKQRLFEPFFTTRGGEGGTGLGLADVADFARAAGATIAVQSEPGAGTTLELRFPTAIDCACSAPAPVPQHSSHALRAL